MKKKIIGAISALLVAGGAVVGYASIDDGKVTSVNYTNFLEQDSVKFINLIKSYNVEFIENTDDSNILTNIIDKNGPDKGRLTYNPLETDNVNHEFIDTLVKSFHFWSYRKYLHLTQFYNDSKQKTNSIPYFLASNNYYQINNYGDIISNGTKGLVLDSFKQAGRDQAILFSQDGKHKVFYSIHMNNLMHSTINDVESTLENLHFVSSKSDTFKIDQPYSAYPIGSEELKISWINVEAIPAEDRKDYIVVKAIVEKKEMEVAMLGMHIVGMVEKFPELLWATFEGPHLAPQNLTNKTDVVNLNNWEKREHNDTITGSGGMSWLFYKEGTTLSYNKDNVITYGKVQDSSFKNQLYRSKPLGFTLNDLNSSANDGFHPFTLHHYLAINNVNYLAKKYGSLKAYYNGSIWLTSRNPNEFFVDAEATSRAKYDILKKKRLGRQEFSGSPDCSNITMESYTQSFNCFTCHGVNNNMKVARPFSAGEDNFVISHQSMLNISHVYSDRVKRAIINYINPDKSLSNVDIDREVERIKQEQEKMLVR